MKGWKIAGMVAALIWAQTAVAQDDSTPDAGGYSPYKQYVTGSATLYYGAGLPFGSQKEFIDKSPTSNVGIAVEAMFPGHFSVGGRFMYEHVKQRLPRQVYALGDGSDVSAVQTRTLTVAPLLAIGSAYLTDVTATVRPYVQLGAGGAFVSYAKYYGLLADQKQGIRAAVAPAVGVKFRFGAQSNIGADIQAQYQHVFFKYDQLDNSQNLMINVGVSYRWW